MRNHPELEYVPVGQIKPYPGHARTHNRKQFRKLEALVRHYGQAVPILIDENNVIVDGHAVHNVLQALGYDQIVVARVKGRTPAEIRALRLALNRLPQESAWDDEKLRDELRELVELSFDMELTGFDAVEIDMALTIEEPGVGALEEECIDDLEPTSGPLVVIPGDVWLLNRHVLACGDARDGELIRRLANGRSVSVVFSDPPYNVKIDSFVSGLGKTRHREFAMASGEMSRDDFITFLRAFIAPIKPVLADGAILYFCIDWRHVLELQTAAEAEGLELKNACVWVKTNAGMGTFYRSQHEFVLVFKHGAAPHQNHFELGQHGRSRSNVWSYRGINTFGKNRMELLGAHPTVKPLALVADALKDVSRRGELVIDTFLGSGTTLLAAEETGRICLGVEIDPGYVEVAIRRWQKRTGRDAIHAETGETFGDRVARLMADGDVRAGDQAGIAARALAEPEEGGNG